MANIVSYLKWRGDLSFAERPFCEVDNLVLAELAYVDFAGIVPEVSEAGAAPAGITLAEAADQCLEQGRKSICLTEQPGDFLRTAATCRRYRDVWLSHHVDILDEEGQTEFSALHMTLEDGTVYVAFRGTGDMLVGWREDFSMSFQLMPAQKAAAAYLERTLPVLHPGEMPNYRIGGHSKGGNLAIYAAMMCAPEKKARILEIYSNDGPGFCESFIDMKKYQSIESRIVRIVPEFSIIGGLFEIDPPTRIVASSADGLVQHDGFTWGVEGDHFCEVPERTEKCFFYNKAIDTWIESADLEQRRVFVQDLFDAFEKTGAKKVSELGKRGSDDFETILLSLANSESRTKIVLGKLLKSFVGTLRSVHFRELLREKKMLWGLAYFGVGLFLAARPAFAAQGIGLGVGAAAVYWLGKKQLECAFAENGDGQKKRIRLVLQMAAMCGIIWLVAQKELLVRFSNVMIGGFFLFHAYRWFRTAVGAEAAAKTRVVDMTFGIVAFLFAMVPLITAGLVLEKYVFGAGVAILLYGAGKILRAMYENGQRNSEGRKD